MRRLPADVQELCCRDSKRSAAAPRLQQIRRVRYAWEHSRQYAACHRRTVIPFARRERALRSEKGLTALRAPLPYVTAPARDVTPRGTGYRAHDRRALRR